MDPAREFMRKPEEKLIKTFQCENCLQEVEQKEMVIPMGPYKGEKITANYGCICPDIKLAKEALKRKEEASLRKIKNEFDYYSLINESLQTATLDNYIPPTKELEQSKRDIEKYIGNFNGKGNLLLHGNYGTGKSHLSIAVTKALMDQGYNCLFLSLPKLLTKIKDTYNNNGITEDELLEAIQKVDLLVLDDIGAEHHTEWVNAKLFEVLDDRAGKATIYTTNLNSKELRTKINERNFSRMMETTEIIAMNGPDYRRKEF